MYNKNKRGTNTDPWGTPHFSNNWSELWTVTLLWFIKLKSMFLFCLLFPVSPQDKRPILAVVPSPAAPFAPGLKEGLSACESCCSTYLSIVYIHYQHCENTKIPFFPSRRSLLSDLWSPHSQWPPGSVQREPKSRAPDDWATHRPSRQEPLRPHLAGAVLPGF